MATKGKKFVSFEWPEAAVEQIDARAEEEGRSRSEVTLRAVQFYFTHAEVEPVAAPSVPKIKGKKKGKGE